MNIEKKRNKIEEINERLSLTDDDLQYIKDKMKEYYGKYNNEITAIFKKSIVFSNKNIAFFYVYNSMTTRRLFGI